MHASHNYNYDDPSLLCSYEKLYRASEQGCESEVKDLLKKGVDPNNDYYNQVHSGWTPLHAACAKNRCSTVELLAKWGANTEAKDRDGDTPILCANRMNCTSCVEMLCSCSSISGSYINFY